MNKGCDTTGPYQGIPYDGSDPAWQDFYYDNYEHAGEHIGEFPPWYTPNKAFHQYWQDCMTEIIDRYSPDLLYTDGALPFNDQWLADDLPYVLDDRYQKGLEVVAYLYNQSIRIHGENQAVYTQKCRYEDVYRVGVLDMERSLLPKASPYPWQTDTCIGGWFYDAKAPYKTPREIIDLLVDVVAKNGCVLLNILQRPDGSIDQEAEYILDEMANWYKIHGEAIFASRPWKTVGEGDTVLDFKDYREDAAQWKENDIRYICKDNIVYAFLMGAKGGMTAVLRSFDEGETIRSVRILGGSELPFHHDFGILTVPLPEKLPSGYVSCLAIEIVPQRYPPVTGVC